MKKIAGFIVLLSLAFGSLASAHVHLEQGDLVKPTAIRLGGDLALTLPENPTTGYRWTVTWSPAERLQMVRDEYIPPAGNLVGAGGLHHFTLRAVQSGPGAVTIQYGRPWQGGEKDPPLFLPVRVTLPGEAYDVPQVLEAGQDAFHPLVDLSLNDFLVVTLADNPSTGFFWTARWNPARELILVSSQYYPGSDLLGAPGITRMLFQAREAGWCLLTLEHVRSSGESHGPQCTMVNITE